MAAPDVLDLIEQQSQASGRVQQELGDVERTQATFNAEADRVTDSLLAIEQAKNVNVQTNAAFTAERLGEMRDAQNKFRAIEDGGFVAGIKEDVADVFGGIIPALRQFSREEQLKVMNRAQQDVALQNENAKLEAQQLESKGNVERSRLRDVAADLQAEQSEVEILRQRSRASLEAFETETALKSAALAKLPAEQIEASGDFTPQQKLEEKRRRRAGVLSASMLEDQSFLTSQSRMRTARAVKLDSLSLADKNEALTKALQAGGTLEGDELGAPGLTFTAEEIQLSRDETAAVFSEQELIAAQTATDLRALDASVDTTSRSLGMVSAIVGGDPEVQIDAMLQREDLSNEDRVALEQIKLTQGFAKTNALDAKTMQAQVQAANAAADGIRDRQLKRKLRELKARGREKEFVAAEEYFATGGIINDVGGAAEVVEDSLGFGTGNSFYNTVQNTVNEIIQGDSKDFNQALAAAGAPELAGIADKIKVLSGDANLIAQVKAQAFRQGRADLMFQVASSVDDPALRQVFEQQSENNIFEFLRQRQQTGGEGITETEFLKKSIESIGDFAARQIRPSGNEKYAQAGLNNVVFQNNAADEFVQRTIQALRFKLDVAELAEAEFTASITPGTATGPSATALPSLQQGSPADIAGQIEAFLSSTGGVQP